MTYFKIGNTDFSQYVNSLDINDVPNYTAQVNANGDTVVDYINSKKEIEVGFVPVNANVMKTIQSALAAFNVTISYLNPVTGAVATANCILPENKTNYYTIQNNKVMFNEFTIKFIEL